MAELLRGLTGVVLLAAILAVSARATIRRGGARTLRRWLTTTRPETWADGRDPQRQFTPGQRRRILRRAGYRCQWIDDQGRRCQAVHGAPGVALEADHVIPWAAGGATVMSNGQALCGPHNREKGARLVDR